MKKVFLSFVITLPALVTAPIAALAHPSVHSHNHPHSHAHDHALLGLDALLLTGLALAVVAGAAFSLRAIKNRKQK